MWFLERKSMHLKCLKQRALEHIPVGEKNLGIEDNFHILSSSYIVKVMGIMMIWIVSLNGGRKKQNFCGYHSG
jgi:hypothetical protein